MYGLVLMLALVIAGCGSLRAQAAPDSIKLRNDCRLAEQALRTGHPAPRVDWARTFLPNCRPEQWAGAATAALGRLRASTDERALVREWGAVTLLRDANLYSLARSIAADAAASTGARVRAMRYLALLLDPRGQYSFDLLTQGVPTGTRVVRPVCSSGRAAGGQLRLTGTALPSDYREQIRLIGAQLRDDGTAPEPVRRAGECLVYAAGGPMN
jgi:hypothetical protein